MNNSKKSETSQEAGDKARTKAAPHQKTRSVATAQQAPTEWTYPSSTSTIFLPSSAPRARTSTRKRRIYADYRELLALESQARKLHFLTPDSVRPTPSEPQAPQLHKRALEFPGQIGITPREEGNIAAGIAEAPMEQLELPVPATPEQPALLVVDQRMNMFFGSRRNLKSVVAANAAALIAWRMLAQGRRIGAIIFNDRKMVQYRPGSGRLHTLLILQTVLSQNHSLLPNAGIYSNPTMLNDALRRVNRMAEGSPVVFLLTDASGCDSETYRLASNISQHSDLLVTLVYDPRQAEFSASNLISGELQNQPGARKSARSLRRKNGILHRHDLLSSGMFPNGVPVVPINTQDDVAYQLRRGFTKSIFSSFARIHHLQASGLSLHAPT